MSLFRTSVQNPVGLNPGPNEYVDVYVRGGDVKIGTIVQFEIDAADAAVTASLNYGAATNPMSNVIASVATEGLATQGLWHLYAVCMEDIDDDQLGQVCIRGDVKLAWDAASDATGSGGTAGSANGLVSLVSANAERVIAIARETTVLYVSGSASTRTQCYFDGINGFGMFST